MFKTKKYLNCRKVAEAVNRILSNSVDPLFYLSSFQNPFAETPGVWSQIPGIFPFPVRIFRKWADGLRAIS